MLALSYKLFFKKPLINSDVFLTITLERISHMSKTFFYIPFMLYSFLSILAAIQIPVFRFSCLYLPEHDTSPHSLFHAAPILLEASVSSSNRCSPSYAIDNDRIICTFTTLKPWFPSSPALYLPTSQQLPSPCRRSVPTPYVLSHPPNDFRHWTCIDSIQNGEVPDQTPITVYSFLDRIFDGAYRYDGPDSAVTYYAPLHYSYLLHYPEDTDENTSQDTPLQLEIISNHSMEFLPYETYEAGTGTYWSLPVIDAAGNGPCCIIISLEDADFLLYNFKQLTDNHYIVSFIPREQ